MTTTTNNGNAAASPRFNLDIAVNTTGGGGDNGFKTAAEAIGSVEVKRSTYVAKMPYTYGSGTLMKRLATIVLPRNKRIAILPHTVSTFDKITDHESVPTDEAGIANYIFDAREWIMYRGTASERKMIEFKFQVESPITVYQIKQAPKVMELLEKHQIYLFGRRYSPAISTRSAGLLLNVDAKKCSQTHLIAEFTNKIKAELNLKVFVDLAPHRGSVRVGQKAIWGDFLKVMVEAEHCQAVAAVIQKGLLEKRFHKGLENVRLMPLTPMRNMMSPETFGEMICAHNNTMYDVAEIQIDHVWEIDSEIELNSTIKEKLGLGNLEDEMFSFREIILRMFWDQWPESKVRDAYIQRGRLMVVCSKSIIAEASEIVDQFLSFMKENFDASDESAEKFATWLGSNTPKNYNRHPARSGTLVYGEERVLKATVNSFMDKNLTALTAGIIPVAGMKASKPDLSRPPRMSLPHRSRKIVHVDPNEFHPTAVAAWTTANAWAAADAPRMIKKAQQKRVQNKSRQAPREVITVDDTTVSTGSMSSTTQAAINKMNETLAKFEANEKENEKKLATLDANMARIASNVVKITEAQDTINKGYIEIREAMCKIAETNARTEAMLKAITNRMGSLNTVISVEDSEMEMSSAGKRDADQISTSSKSSGASQSSQSQSSLGMSQESTTSTSSHQSGATIPRTTFLQDARNVFSDSFMDNSQNVSETQEAGVQ